jgi:hypothetical protein
MKVRSALAVTLVSAVALMVALVAPARAGDLEPPGPPAPTMKTLDQIPPSWSQTLSTETTDQEYCYSPRFTCVLSGEAVLDKETGLVWARTPSTDPWGWSDAHYTCNQLRAGNRLGWRLPALQELGSLLELPRGIPFGPFIVPPGRVEYWSATTVAASPTHAWRIDIDSGVVASEPKDTLLSVWCVRGGRGADSQ